MNEKSPKSFDARRKLARTVERSDPTKSTDPKQSEKNANSAVQLCRRFLKLLGVWESHDDGNFSWRFAVSYFLTIVCYFGLGIRTIPTVAYMILDTKDLMQLCTLVARLLFCFMSCSKYLCLQLHRRDIGKCMKHIERDWLDADNSVSREIMLEYSRYGLLVTRICAVFTYTGATWQATLPHVLKKTAAVVVNPNATSVVPVRLFTVPSHFGFSAVTKTPVYEIVYTSQIVATYMMHSIALASYSVAVVSVMHACGQLKILMEKIRNLIDEDGRITEYNDDVEARLSDIIRQHVRILRFISCAERMLRGICLIELGGCTLELCFCGYFNLAELRSERKNVIAILVWTMLVIMFTFNVFSFCFIGELLTQECAKVGEITYMIDWYRLPGKQPLALCLIMTMAHSPVTITAGGTIPMSFRCFASVMKTSVGYLNMLRTVMD